MGARGTRTGWARVSLGARGTRRVTPISTKGTAKPASGPWSRRQRSVAIRTLRRLKGFSISPATSGNGVSTNMINRIRAKPIPAANRRVARGGAWFFGPGGARGLAALQALAWQPRLRQGVSVGFVCPPLLDRCSLPTAAKRRSRISEHEGPQHMFAQSPGVCETHVVDPALYAGVKLAKADQAVLPFAITLAQPTRGLNHLAALDTTMRWKDDEAPATGYCGSPELLAHSPRGSAAAVCASASRMATFHCHSVVFEFENSAKSST
jgi:hypothetical protein